MPVRDILQIGHPLLEARAAEVDVKRIGTAQVQGWVEDMIDTMRAAHGAGIAANQIGIPYRLFVMEVNDNPRYPYKPPMALTVAINPEIKFLSEQTFPSNEGCLSVPQIRATVERHVEIAVSYHDRRGIKRRREVRGYSACTWQHEYDHLNGILFPHRVRDPKTFCSWSVFRQYRPAEFAEAVGRLVKRWGA